MTAAFFNVADFLEVGKFGKSLGKVKGLRGTHSKQICFYTDFYHVCSTFTLTASDYFFMAWKDVSTF